MLDVLALSSWELPSNSYQNKVYAKGSAKVTAGFATFWVCYKLYESATSVNLVNQC